MASMHCYSFNLSALKSRGYYNSSRLFPYRGSSWRIDGVTKHAATTHEKKKAITVFRPRSSPVAAAIKRPVVIMIYPPQVAVARAAPIKFADIRKWVVRVDYRQESGVKVKMCESPMLPHVTLFKSDHSLLRFLR